MLYTKIMVIFFSVLINNAILSTINYEKLYYYNSLIPKDIELRGRVLTTVSCEDCSSIPKVPEAGQIIDFNGDQYQIMHNGLKIAKDCYYGTWMTHLISLLKGHHEPQEERIFYDVLKLMPAKAVMVELGSYWGYYSMWFQKEVPYATNYFIEPDPKNLIIGEKNFTVNNLQGHFLQAMIGEHSSESESFTDWDYNHYKVKQINLDDFVESQEILFIDILHSDIQGAEVEMLHGCKKLIENKKIGYFFISTHRGTHEKCIEFFNNMNLEVIVSITREESFSADGLIVAKLPELKNPEAFPISRRTSEFCKIVETLLNDKI